MFAEISQLLLCLCLSLSLYFGIKGFALSYSTNFQTSSHLISRSLARTSVLISVLILSCFLLLMQLFIVSDFSVLLVATHSNALLPVQYKIAATWGSHEGSFLLWVLMLACWNTSVTLFSHTKDDLFYVRTTSIMLLLIGVFLLYLIFASNPFARVFPVPLTGQDLNPLLQDPFMVIHPPMLYMGYVGFAVCFSMAVAALTTGEVNSQWAKYSRPWANAAWAFLTLGILLGSWWAYRELGWGGWWFWDPVENASLMPWFAGAALVHSLAVTDKRNAMKSWAILLAIIAFGFSLLGTFLVRSGVLTSVHSFASDPTRGVFILIMTAGIIGAALIFYALRASEFKIGQKFSPISKESLLLVNNVVMTAALSVVMIGTLYPLIAEVLTGRKMSVGPPYFNSVITPILVPAVFLMSLAPWMLWKDSKLLPALKNVAIPAFVGGMVAITFMLINEKTTIATALGILFSICLLLGTIYSAIHRLHLLKINAKQKKDLEGVVLQKRVRKLGSSYWGMFIGHCGLAIFALGVTFVMSFQVEKDIVLKPSEVYQLGNHSVKFVGVRPISGVNFTGVEGIFELRKDGETKARILHPQKRKYIRSDDPMTEAAVDYGFFGDVYLSLGEATNLENIAETSWTIRASYKPLMVWVWIGCLFMAIGGFVAIFGKKQSLALPSRNKRIAVNTNLASKQNETTVKPT